MCRCHCNPYLRAANALHEGAQAQASMRGEWDGAEWRRGRAHRLQLSPKVMSDKAFALRNQQTSGHLATHCINAAGDMHAKQMIARMLGLSGRPRAGQGRGWAAGRAALERLNALGWAI